MRDPASPLPPTDLDTTPDAALARLMAQAIALRAAIASEQEAFGRRISALEASRAEFLMRQRELLARVARLERQQDDASLVERLHANQLRAHSFDPAELRER